MNYCLDTSGILDGWRRNYPPDVFLDIPELLNSLIDDGRVFISDEVIRELSKVDDDVTECAKSQEKAIVVPEEDIQEKVVEILAKHPKMVSAGKGRSGADPFVIATAAVKGAMVVTGEVFSNNLDKPRIPDVCRALGIRCGTFLDMLRQEGWKFSRNT